MSAPVPYAQAHRGLSAEHPENTLPAFRAAVQAGFPALELDLRVTRDHEVVVMHDAGIERTTNGNGRVADMAYDELRTYRCGPHGAGGPVPRLDDLFTELDSWPGLWNLEVKAHAATASTLHLVEHHDLAKRAQVSSMDLRVLEEAKSAMPSLARGLIVLGPVDPEEVAAAKAVGCAWLNVDHEALTREAAAAAVKAGLKVATWTVNDAARAKELVGWGVSSIITDRREVHAALGPARSPSF